MSKWWLFGLVAFNTVDVITTISAVRNHSAIEYNPLVAMTFSLHPILWVLVKTLLLWTAAITITTDATHHPSWIMGFKVATVFYGLLAVFQMIAIWEFWG